MFLQRQLRAAKDFHVMTYAASREHVTLMSKRTGDEYPVLPTQDSIAAC